MFIRQKKTALGTAIYALVENHRIDGKVKQRVVAHLGQSPPLIDAIYSRERSAQWALRRAQMKPSTRWMRARRRKWDCDWPRLKTAGCANWREYADQEWERNRLAFRKLHEEHLKAMRKLEEIAKRGMTDEQEEQFNAAYYEHRRHKDADKAESSRQFFARFAALSSGGLKSAVNCTIEDTTEDAYCGA
jgi:hypothetical protein